jgi:hypothetical protein
MIVQNVLVSAVFLIATSAFANAKADRDYRENELKPAIAAAEKDFKAGCGCGLAINIGKDVSGSEELTNVKRMAETISSGAAGYCNSKESKAAMCKMKKIDVAKGADVSVTFAGGKVKAVVSAQSYPSFDMIAEQVDK